MRAFCGERSRILDLSRGDPRACGVFDRSGPAAVFLLEHAACAHQGPEQRHVVGKIGPVSGELMGQRPVLPLHSHRDHIRGSADAAVTLLEYGDYQCTTCRAAHATVEAIRGHMGPHLGFAFRHLPLVHIHPRAQRAAEAAECASAQGRFWAMHDALFEHQGRVGDDDLLLYAVDVHIDVVRFARDLAARRYARRVQADCVSGMQGGVTATPTFFVNNVRLRGRFDVESLLAAIERASANYPLAR